MSSRAYFNSDTIAAVITAPNAFSALGVIRISGPAAWQSVSPLIRPLQGGGKFVTEEIESHKLYRCLCVAKDGHPLDDGMFVWMKAPRSYTGEEVLELNLHGNPLLLRRVMHELMQAGAREALPGEFSFRAFRNGKLSLDQAEAVADLIASRSEEGARRALDHLLGRVRKEISELKKELVDRAAEVEIDIDFSDQGLSIIRHDEWAAKLESWCERVSRMRAEYLSSQPLREGIRLALVGEPNSGKSSLFNRLLGDDRSIVSPEAGTTRDVVRESLQLGSLSFRVSDTAGIRATSNSIESQGIERSYGEAGSAHLVLWVFDGSQAALSSAQLDEAWRNLRARLGEKAKLIALWNKADLGGPMTAGWAGFFEERKIPALAISALNGSGMPELQARILQLFATEADNQPDFWISRTRHFEVLGKAVDLVKGAVGKVRAGELFPDLLAADLRAALAALGEITGEFSSDDLLNHIFSEFCIGK